MKKAIGVLGFIGAVSIGFSISTAAGIAAIIALYILYSQPAWLVWLME